MTSQTTTSQTTTSQTTCDSRAFERPAAVLQFRPQRTFAETAASMRQAFEDLRAAEDALERQLVEIRAHIDACGLPHHRAA